MEAEIKFTPAVQFLAPVQIHMTNDLPMSQSSAKPNSAMPSTLQFQEIPIGQHFEFPGRRYKKLALSMASDEDQYGTILTDGATGEIDDLLGCRDNERRPGGGRFGDKSSRRVTLVFMSGHLNAKIQITKDGPYLVSGGLPLREQSIVTNAQGESLDYKEEREYPAQPHYALCRCGQSGNKPFCDGTHKKVQFDGTETASREPYLEQAQTIEGPTMLLTDAESLCAFARFCDPKGRIWNLVRQTDDPEARRLVEYEAGHCPAGRLVAWDRQTGKPIEPKFQPSLGLIEDTAKQVSGPIWVRGGIPVISADGKAYEVRNRMTLCRCGRSANKPFCDGSHAT